MFRRTATAPLLAAALICVATAAAAQAPQIRTVADTGLFTLYPGSSARLFVVEAGGANALPTQVTLRLIDDRNRVVGSADGEMRNGKAVRLTVSNPQSADRRGVPVRGQAILRTGTNNAATVRILTLELVNDRTLESAPAANCLIPYDPRNPTGPFEGNCGCGIASDFTT